MDDFEINYAITADDYAEANNIAYRKSGEQVRQVIFCIVAGMLLGIMPFFYRLQDGALNYPLIFSAPLGAYFLYCGVLVLFPGWYSRRAHPGSNMDGTKFTARFSATQVEVRGENIQWTHKWPAYKWIHESQDLFVFHDEAGILFIFAKRHFTMAQIDALQRLIQEHQSKS
jgi:hypothetical protein